MKMDQTKFLSLITMSIFASLSCSDSKYIIEHTEQDCRYLEKYFIYPIIRPDLELINITLTDYDFQLMNADEWGVYFDLIRINFKKGRVEIVIQDTIHPIPRKYEFRQFDARYNYTTSVDSLIKINEIWSINDTLNSNRIIDGGDYSIVIIGENKSKLITWQDFKRNETDEKVRV